jgi:hypothetical protein
MADLASTALTRGRDPPPRWVMWILFASFSAIGTVFFVVMGWDLIVPPWRA